VSVVSGCGSDAISSSKNSSETIADGRDGSAVGGCHPARQGVAIRTRQCTFDQLKQKAADPMKLFA
jgi:hypothetical protein